MTVLSSLTNRIFVAGALLVVLSIGVAIYRVNSSVARQAEADLRAGLAEASSLVDAFSRTQFADFVVKGRLIADLPTLKGAAATDDPPTVQPIALENQQRVGADLFVVLGGGDRVLARAGRVQPADADVAALLAACRAGQDSTAFFPFSGGVLHAVAIPMEALSTLIVGVSLDRDAAERIKTVTNSEIVFAIGPRIVASTMDEARTSALAGTFERSDVFNAWIDGEEYIARQQPLGGHAPGAPVALVLRSRTEHLRFLQALRWQMALTGLAAVMAATVLGYLIARTVTRPLRALTATMREMAATGDLGRSVPPGGRWDDEDARLVATTFRQLTGALNRFQHEVAQRERLSSLGRLSTVIAHEIRNPLMIIKSAARGLRKSAAPEVIAVADNIDEEVARLNRVVTGVLDFARPIAFDFGDADLAAICRDAAQAAQAGPEDVPIVVETPASGAIVTDAERLRAVLVNVLANAQQAVRDRPGSRPAGALIRLKAARAENRWRIDVADQGTGVAPDDLPRILDPFFTTRRGGSGLGLAIARNIIEGLGGTIAIDSRERSGTTVHIVLPDRGAGAAP